MSIPVAVGKEPSALGDDAAAQLNRTDMVGFAEVDLQTCHTVEVARLPPVDRKAINDELGGSTSRQPNLSPSPRTGPRSRAYHAMESG